MEFVFVFFRILVCLFFFVRRSFCFVRFFWGDWFGINCYFLCWSNFFKGKKNFFLKNINKLNIMNNINGIFKEEYICINYLLCLYVKYVVKKNF